MLSRWFPGIAAVLLTAMLLVEVSSIRGESQTWDEAIYLAAGYSYWHGSDHRLNREHPLLGKLLVALPLLAYDLRLPVSDPSSLRNGEVAVGRAFLYDNVVPAEKILFLGRCATIFLSIVLGIALAYWTRIRAGPWAATIALVLYAFDPTVLAHARYATNDLAVTLFGFCSVCLWDWALRSGRRVGYAAAGIALALAIATKESALFLFPVFAILALVTGGRKALLGGAAITAAALAVALYVCSLGDVAIYRDSILASAAHTTGALSYLYGMESTHGWWWYFPAAFAVKAPVALLVLTLLTAILVIRHLRRCSDLLPLAVPIVVYGFFCLVDRADMGVRYLLPMYPFAFVAIGIVSARFANRIVVLLILTLFVGESLSVYPNELAFFNFVAGGPAAGPRYLIDSNIDWGQDLKKLRDWYRAHAVHETCISYFGTAPLSYYGLQKGEIPPYWDLPARRHVRCVVAVSVTYLYGGDFVGRDAARWLRRLTPTARVGYSIYVYDLRYGDPTLRQHSVSSRSR